MRILLLFHHADMSSIDQANCAKVRTAPDVNCTTTMDGGRHISQDIEMVSESQENLHALDEGDDDEDDVDGEAVCTYIQGISFFQNGQISTIPNIPVMNRDRRMRF